MISLIRLSLSAACSVWNGAKTSAEVVVFAVVTLHAQSALLHAHARTVAASMGAEQSAGTHSAPPGGPPLDLAGEWVPCRKSEWYNNNLGKHCDRAAKDHTRITFQRDGTGSGKVGEFAVAYQVTTVGHAQYTAVCRVPHGWGAGWIAKDGKYKKLDDGTLQIKYPSNGITEYWRRADGRHEHHEHHTHPSHAPRVDTLDQQWMHLASGVETADKVRALFSVRAAASLFAPRARTLPAPWAAGPD